MQDFSQEERREYFRDRSGRAKKEDLIMLLAVLLIAGLLGTLEMMII